MPTSSTVPTKRWSSRAIAISTVALLAGIFVMVLAFVSLGKASGFLTHLAAEPLPTAPRVATSREPNQGSTISSEATAASQVASNAASLETIVLNDSSPALVPVPAALAGAMPAVTAEATTGGANNTTPAATPPTLGGSGGVAGGGGSVSIAGFGGGPGAPADVTTPLVAALALINMGASQACGNNTCNVGLVCCNRSCGTCAAPGASCDQAECDNAPTFPAAIPCGLNSCSQGQVCCNQSCGLCAAPGEACSQQICS